MIWKRILWFVITTPLLCMASFIFYLFLGSFIGYLISPHPNHKYACQCDWEPLFSSWGAAIIGIFCLVISMFCAYFFLKKREESKNWLLLELIFLGILNFVIYLPVWFIFSNRIT